MLLEQKNVKKAGDFDLVLINSDLFKPDLSDNDIAYTRGRTDKFCSFSSRQDKRKVSAGAKKGLEAQCVTNTYITITFFKHYKTAIL